MNNHLKPLARRRALTWLLALLLSTYSSPHITALSAELCSYPSFASCQLSGADFGGQFLPNADFSGANLENANFQAPHEWLQPTSIAGAKFDYANLTGANLAGVGLTKVSFRNATLKGAQISGDIGGVDFTGADLFGVISGGVTGVPAQLPQGWLVRAGRLIGPGVDLTSASLTNNDLFKADLTGVRSGGVTSRNNPQLPPHWALVDGYLIGPGADLTDANLTNIDLTQVSNGPFTGSPKLPRGWFLEKSYLFGPGSEIKDADLKDANLKTANLKGSHILRSNLFGANLGNTNLLGTVFSGSNVSNANFGGARLVRTNFTGTNMNGSDFTKAWFKEVYGCGILGTPLLPDGWKQVGDDIIGPSVQLINCDLRNEDFTNANLSAAIISWASVDGANFSKAVLTGIQATYLSGTPAALPKGWAIVDKTLVGPEANLSNTVIDGDLSGVDLSHANLFHARISSSIESKLVKLPAGWKMISNMAVGPGANINGIDISGADLSGVNLAGVIGWVRRSTDVKLPNGWAVIQGRLIGPGADLTDAVLPGADLATLKLDGVRGKLSSFSGISLPSGWFLRSGYILGKTADLSNVIASGLDLTGVDLGQAIFQGSRLTSIKGSPKLPAGFAVNGGTLVGPGTDLTGFECASSLGSIKLKGAKITGFKCKTNFAQKVDFAGALTDDKDISLPDGWVVSDSGLIVGKITNLPEPSVLGFHEVGQTLTAVPGTWDSGVKLTYQWLRDGAPIPGANKSDFTLTGDDFNKKISVSVTGSKVGYQSEEVRSIQTLVNPGTQRLTPSPTLTGSTKVGQTLTTNPGTWDTGAVLSYQWLRDGVEIPQETSATHALSPLDFGKSISVQVTSKVLGFLDVSKTSSPSKVSAGVMAPSMPRLSGTVKVGSTIKTVVSPWVSGAKITYKWFANGVQIKGQNSSSLKLLATYKAKRIAVEVTQSATGYTLATKSSQSVLVK